MIDYLIFGEFDSRDYNLAVCSNNSFDNPKREMRKIEIPGRNGSLYEDLGYFKNAKMSYDLIAYNIQDATVFFDDIKAKFFSSADYKRLEDSENADCYMMATFTEALSVRRKSARNDAFILRVSFDRKPQKFLKSGEFEIISPNELFNPTSFASSPVVKFKTIEESGRILIGNNEILISGANYGEELVYDAETMICQNVDGENRSSLIYTEDQIRIEIGKSDVAVSGVAQLKIIPRWWKL